MEGETYTWQMTVMDAVGNSAELYKGYKYTINTGVLPEPYRFGKNRVLPGLVVAEGTQEGLSLN
jgi:hypothetical protein